MIEVKKLKFNEFSAIPEGVACKSDAKIGPSTYSVIPSSIADRMLIILENTTANAINIKVLKGGGYASIDDLTYSISANSKVCIVVESALYAKSEKVIIQGTTGIKVSAIELA